MLPAQYNTYFCVDVFEPEDALDSLGTRFIVLAACADDAKDYVKRELDDPKSDLFLTGEPVDMGALTEGRVEVKTATRAEIDAWGLVNPVAEYVRA